MTIRPTGFHVRRQEGDVIVLERTFRAPIDDVWAAITESDRLARWIGSYTGDPADGFVMFTMNAEGDEGMTPVRYQITRCDEPEALYVEAVDDFGRWTLLADLAESGGVTTLRLSQIAHDPSIIESTGPGWEYYLDRLVAAETKQDVEAVNWDDYYPAMRDHYLDIARSITATTAD